MQPLFFKPELNNKAEEFKKYLPVNVNLNFKTLAPYIYVCEKKYIQPVLGTTLFNALTEYYALDEALQTNEKHNHLVELIQFALIRLAYYTGYDVLSVQLSDTGASAKVDKEQRLYRYQEENIKQSLKNEGFDTIDTIVDYVQTNIDNFTAFTQSDYYKGNIRSFIKSTADFDNIINIGRSHLVFQRMRQFINDVENIELRHFIGNDFVETLIDTTDTKYDYILRYIKEFVVYRAFANGIIELHKLPTEKGLVFETQNNDGFRREPVDEHNVMRTADYYNRWSERYMAQIIDHLKKNINEYPEFVGGNDYPTSDDVNRNNYNKHTFFA